MEIRAWALALAAALPLVVVAADDASSSSSGAERVSRGSSVPQIELTELIARVSKRDGKQFIVDPRVRALVPLVGFDAGDVDIERLLALLRVNGFVAVEEKGFYTVQPDAVMRQLSGPVYTDLNFKALDEDVVTVLLTAKNACAAHMVPILRPLMPQAAHLAAHLQSNTMVISDRAANARRIGGMIERIDRVTAPGKKCEAPPPMPPRDPSDAKDAKDAKDGRTAPGS